MNFIEQIKEIRLEAFGVEQKDLYRMTNTELKDYSFGFDYAKRDKRQRISDRLMDAIVSRSRFVGTKSQKAYKKMIRNYAVIKIFTITGVFKEYSIGLAKRVVKISQGFGATEITIDLSKHIFMHYSRIGGKKEADKYFDLASNLNQTLSLEIKAQWYLSKLIYAKKQLSNKELHIKTLGYLSELYQSKPDSIKYNKILFMISCFRYRIENKYEDLERVATQAMYYFQNLHFHHFDSEMIFKNYLIEAQIRKTRVDEALSMIDEGLTINNLTSFKHYELLFRILMRKGLYNKAKEVYSYLVESKFLNKIEYANERMCLYKFYLDAVSDEHGIKRLRMDIGRLSRIKNIRIKHHLLISEIIFHVLKGDIHYISENRKVIAKSALHKVNSNRGRLFLNMLMLLPMRIYDSEKFSIKCSTLLETLKNQPIDIDDLEIISYEVIWESLLVKGQSFHRIIAAG